MKKYKRKDGLGFGREKKIIIIYEVCYSDV